MQAYLPVGVPKYCFANAYQLAKDSAGTLQYAEGVALAPYTLTVHRHAWCIDTELNVVDPTWHGELSSPPGAAYFGLVFDLEHMTALRRGPKKAASALNDWKRGFPLFKTPRRDDA